MPEKHQPFGPSFNRDMEALIAAIQVAPHLFTPADVRANFAKAGIIFTDTVIPEIRAPEPQEYSYMEEDTEDVGFDD
jgi:hypothetical protein